MMVFVGGSQALTDIKKYLCMYRGMGPVPQAALTFTPSLGIYLAELYTIGDRRTH